VGQRPTNIDDNFFIVYDPIDIGFGIRAGQGYVSVAKVINSIFPHSYGDDQLFWRIWFEPETIDAGFIVESVEHNIKIWNAYLDQLATITAISGVDEDGTTLDYETPPIKIGKFGDKWFTLTIETDGPPIQDSSWEFTVEGVTYDSQIDGIRIVSMPWEPDWDSKYRVEIHMETAIDRNSYFAEQRRPLRHLPLYKFSLRYKETGVPAQLLKHTIAYGHDKVFGVPVYNEHCYPSASFYGSTTINTSNDLSTNWALNNRADYVVIIDHTTMEAEVKEISSVSSNSIEVTIAVATNFNYLTSIVYPLIMCTCDTSSLRPESDNALVGDLVFTQYERATGV
jgi:hypothetical protein